MSETLIILLGQSPDAPIRWGRFGDGRFVAGGRLDDATMLANLAAEALEDVVAILPGEQAALRRLTSPPKNDGKLKSAALYLLEDELAENVAELHVAVATDEGDGLAIAVKSAIVERWLEAFEAAGISPTTLTVDYLTLLSSPAPVVIFDGDRTVVAASGGGFAVETALFSEIAKPAFTPSPERIRVLGAMERARVLPQTAQLESLGPANDATLLLFYAEAVAARTPPNLLQGRFRRRRAWGPVFAAWRRSAMLAAASIAALGIFVVADAVGSARIAHRFNEAAREIHAAAFPDSADQDPAAHARRLLGTGGDGLSFLALSTRFAEAAEVDKKVQIDRINFDSVRGEMIVSVRSSSDLDIEALKTRLSERGVVARDNGGYRRSGAYWVGELAARAR